MQVGEVWVDRFSGHRRKITSINDAYVSYTLQTTTSITAYETPVYYWSFAAGGWDLDKSSVVLDLIKQLQDEEC